MKVTVQLFGAFRDFESDAEVQLEVPEGARVADLRQSMLTYGRAHWANFPEGLLKRSAFASESCVLGELETLPLSGLLVVLPPVAGG